MGIFTKAVGTVFLKDNSSAEEYISKLEVLRDKAEGELKDKIEKQITVAQYGILGENKIAFELKNSGMDMYILRDIYLEYGDLSAQIDYIVVTRKRIYVLECKNLFGNIEVDQAGNFIRNYEVSGRKIREGIYSPITQNERHLNVIKLLRKESKSNFITKKLFENGFANTYQSLIVLANPKTVLYAKYAKKEVKEKIVRADQLIQKIKEMDAQVTDYSFSNKDMLETAEFYLAINRPNQSDYTRKYEELIAETEKAADRQEAVSASNSVDIIAPLKGAEEYNMEKSEMLEDNFYTQASAGMGENAGTETGETQEVLVAKLKEFRTKQSRLEKIKPYYIFNDAQMQDLISKRPKTMEELLSVSGFGSKKTEKYGDEILKILREV